MKRSDFRPSPPAPVHVHRDGDRYTLVLVRELQHPPEAVWSALTDPAQLREWAPFDPDRNLAALGGATLLMEGELGEPPVPSACQVRTVTPPSLLEYTWDEDVLRWELAPTATGTRLTLLHTLSDPDWLPKVTAGWHICFDVAALLLGGAPVGRFLAEDTKTLGVELTKAYVELLREK